VSSSDDGWIAPADMHAYLLDVYRKKYTTDRLNYYSDIRENYRLHYIAAKIKKYPRSIERMEYIANYILVERMLKS